ncbi:hypothetical protein [Sorangium cellulosum]|nr:hypothetical protein [Sorangium cellulosum]
MRPARSNPRATRIRDVVRAGARRSGVRGARPIELALRDEVAAPSCPALLSTLRNMVVARRSSQLHTAAF